MSNAERVNRLELYTARERLPFEVVKLVERIRLFPTLFSQFHALADYVAVVARADRKFKPLRIFVHLSVCGRQGSSLGVLIQAFLLFVDQLLCFI